MKESAVRKKIRGARARKVIDRLPASQGWHSTDEDEIDRRRERAEREPIEIRPLEPDHPVFGTFAVGAAGGPVYEVEIRSLAVRANSCGCPDHRVNGLGTCKHVEAVGVRLQKKLGRRFEATAGAGGERIEIYLKTTAEERRVAILWPKTVRRTSKLGESLLPFFGEDGSLLADPRTTLPVLLDRVAGLSKAEGGRVRLSRHLAAWRAEQERRARRTAAKEAFLADVAAGKRSLHLVRHRLYPYQEQGALHLAFTERALLGDEMGLGKTVQAVAACELLRQLRGIERVLVVCPASLKAEWEEQIAKFTGLPSRLIYGPRAERLRQYREGAFFYLTNYEQVVVDGPDIQRLLAPDVVILDEAQRIKNWQTKTAQAVKQLQSPYAFVLTGTPIENRIDDIYSIAQFLDPGLFGPLFRFNRDFYELDDRGRAVGYKNLGELHRRLKPILLRRRKEEVETELPGRTVNTYFVAMEPEQKTRYEEYNDRVAKLIHIAERRPLTPAEFDRLQKFLACMRMLCDTPYILDRECRICPKLSELEEILAEQLADPERKILIFSEWERMLDLVRDLVREMGVGFAWHTGSVPQPARREEIRRFKDSPDCRVFLSTDSGSVGLNLQAASVVINLDLPWNPARLEQRIARAWRKHQTRSVQVIHLVTEDSIEHRMMHRLAGKKALAEGVLDGRGDLESLPLPSGRAAFLSRLEEILGTSRLAEHQPADGGEATLQLEPEARVQALEPGVEPAERFRRELVANLGEGLLLLEHQVGGDGRETLLAVVETLDAADAGAVGARAEEALTRSFEGLVPPCFELLDRTTYETLLRLAKQGIVQFRPEGRITLHQASSIGEAEPSQRERRLIRAREAVARGERKLRMASLLAGGGFAAEALPALSEALDHALRGLAHLAGAEVPEEGPFPLASPVALLLGQGDAPAQGAIALRARLTAADGSTPIADELAQEWVSLGESLLPEIGEVLNREALGGGLAVGG
ncbi:MAG TPA: DEAD/DEAH box helicase [Thermoanaerobaculia bacterium]|jgi:superfamily II DNA or RNA helicase|nr:DEAD/DEAH box helicase [Thermoanaerobaculia bacterium]